MLPWHFCGLPTIIVNHAFLVAVTDIYSLDEDGKSMTAEWTIDGKAGILLAMVALVLSFFIHVVYFIVSWELFLKINEKNLSDNIEESELLLPKDTDRKKYNYTQIFILQ